MWSRKYNKCVSCGKTTERHISRGLCAACYHRDIERRHKRHVRVRGIAAPKLTKKYLIDQYVRKKRSLSEIAEDCSCSRQYVHKRMGQLGIPRRSLRSARNLALRQTKIKVERIDDAGEQTTVVYHRITFNRKFFSRWSSKMAYVLGVVFTDGCLHVRKQSRKSLVRRVPHLSMAQKNPELLLKVLALMECNAKLHSRPKKKYGDRVSGAVYSFDFTCASIYPDLLKLGLSSKKSLDIEFPDIPDEYVRHFIRGCWDGDGSIYIENRTGKLCASFVSGSEKFIEGILKALEKAGLPKRTIYVRKGKTPSYYFRYCGKQCLDLCHFLYDDVLSTQYLERKHTIFKRFSKRFEKDPRKPIQASMFE